MPPLGRRRRKSPQQLGIAKITVDIHVGTILTKMGALNRNQAIAKAIVHDLIQLPDDVNAEHKSAKRQATDGHTKPAAPIALAGMVVISAGTPFRPAPGPVRHLNGTDSVAYA